MRSELQPMIEVASDELSKAIDLTLQLRADFLLHPERRRLLLRGNPVPAKEALAHCEDRIERGAIETFAIKSPLALLLIRSGQIFPEGLWRTFEESLKPMESHSIARSARLEIHCFLERRQIEEIHQPAILATWIGNQVIEQQNGAP